MENDKLSLIQKRLTANGKFKKTEDDALESAKEKQKELMSKLRKKGYVK